MPEPQAFVFVSLLRGTEPERPGSSSSRPLG
jgi:hypothetical protein